MFKKNISQGRHKDGAFSLPTILQSSKKSFWRRPHLMIIIMMVIAQGGNSYDDDDNNQRFIYNRSCMYVCNVFAYFIFSHF